MKVAFLIRSMEVGGAERQLAYLARGLNEKGVSVTVGIFYGGGALEDLLKSDGIKIEYLEKRSRWDVLGFLWSTLRWIRREKPEVLHGYLVGANLVSMVIKFFNRRLHVVWGVRASNMQLDNYDRLAKYSFRLSVLLSRLADLIIVNSNSGYDYHLENGYPADRMVVIPNGIDTVKFSPDSEVRQRQRSAWGINENHILVGIVGRFDPMKDHRTFLQAAREVLSKNLNVIFVCIGDGDKEYLADLQRYADELDLSDYILWKPVMRNVESVYNALDILVSTSSFGEGFSNTIAEAMSCGVRCVATNVGDSEMIISDTGIIVPPGDSAGVAEGIHRIAGSDEQNTTNLKISARDHIVKNYSIDSLVENTLASFRAQLFI